jgi:tetratricopeptide (TPR) repeat protein
MNHRRSAALVARPLATLLVAALAFGAGRPSQAATVQDPVWPQWLVPVFTWLAAVNTHEPGRPDGAIGTVAGAPLLQLQDILSDVLALGGRLSDSDAKPVDYRGRRFTAQQLRDVLGVRADEPITAGMNRLLRRAAVLHADVALTGSDPGFAAGAAPRPGRPSYVVGDGQRQRQTTSTVHWAFGRVLLDRLKPSPSRDPLARAWYVATASALQAHRMVSEADDHLSHARQIFPDDAMVLFEGGCALETLTAPTVLAAQAGMVGGPRGPRPLVTPPSTRTLLDRAEQLFRRALQRDPGLVEARVRLARLTAAHGRHSEAIDLLQRALGAPSADDVRYLALMLLGDELRKVGRLSDAGTRYEEAAELLTTAQSPLLALAQLAQERGDRPATAAAVERLARLPPDPEARVDPVWAYYVMRGRDVERLMRQLHALAAQEAK